MGDRPAISQPERPYAGVNGVKTAISTANSGACRVGAHLAVRAPPGTVRAILTAYGSTSETTERHIFQQGQCSVTVVSSPQLSLCPLVDKTQIAPIVITTGLSSDNVVVYDFGSIFQR